MNICQNINHPAQVQPYEFEPDFDELYKKG